MYETLKTFICVGKLGSFSQAARELFLTANGVKKRMNQLEQATGIVLFERDNKGVRLTAAGQSFYDDCIRMEKSFFLAVQRARDIQEDSMQMLRIGMMATFFDSFMVTPWRSTHDEDKIGRRHIIYYGSNLEEMHRMFKDVGVRSDCCVDLYDKYTAEKYHLKAEKLSEYSLWIGFPQGMKIECGKAPHELPDVPLALLMRGRSRVFDRIWDDFAGDKRLFEINDYSIKTFNECYIRNAAIICTGNLTTIFPFYTFVPLRFNRKVCYGIYYNEPQPIIQSLIREIPSAASSLSEPRGGSADKHEADIVEAASQK